jgi:N-[(2S)-2-amino-2-carboxyethyl]-L-glutamate dehydrogenase
MPNVGWSILYLSQEDCVEAGGAVMTEALKATERSFFLHGKKDYIQPGKQVLRWGDASTEETTGRIFSMPSFLGGKDYADELIERGLLGPVNTSGIKFIPSRPDNPAKGLPRATGLIIIVDPDTLIPICVMDGAIVSAMRTGAASGVAAKYLANPDSKVFGLIGASVQGMTQAAAIKAAVPSLEVLRVYDINDTCSRIFADKMAARLGMEVVPVSCVCDAFVESDVISTATMAREPYVNSEWYKEGAFHTEISFWDTPPAALAVFDRIFVDDWYQVKHHGVDVSWRAVKEGFIPESNISGELGEVVTGLKEGRTDAKERIFFNPIGMGIHDLSEAHRVYQNAVAKGIGTNLNYFKSNSGWLDALTLGLEEAAELQVLA